MADPVAGTWASAPNDEGASLHVTISPCGAKFCGVITKVLGSDNTSSVGKRMIWGMSPAGSGVYKGGKVWAPDTDKTYKGKLELSGNSLKVSGCVLGGAVCRGNTFKRLN